MKTKLTRERTNLKPQSAAFQRKMREQQAVDTSTYDNLIKMTEAIVEGVSYDDLKDRFEVLKGLDVEAGDGDAITHDHASGYFA